MEKDTYTCPDCDSRLLFKNGCLVKNTNSESSKSLEKDQERLSQLRKKLSKRKRKHD